jgi:hypothetical protein
MRRKGWCLAVCLLLTAGALFAASKQMSVTVKVARVLATPSYLGKLLGTLSYGDRVTLLDQPADAPKGWLKIAGPDGKLQGWVNATALTEKEIKVNAGSDVEQKASSGDVAAAGKGFNSDVEAQYKQDQKLDYTWVDTMEGYEVPPEKVDAFLQSGGLAGQGGGQ